MKKNIYLTTIWIITIFCMIGGSCYHIMGWGEQFFNDIKLDLGMTSAKTDNNTELSAFDNISFDIDISEVIITTGDTYQLSYTSTKNLVPEYEVKDNTLHITQTSKNRYYPRRNGHDNCSISITVPRDAVLSKISGNCDMGDLEIIELNAEDIDITCDLGNISITDTTADTMTIDCNLGNCEIYKCAFNSLTASNDMGNIEATGISTPLSDYTIDCSVSMGAVEINGKDYYSHYEQEGTTDKKIKLENSMGSIEISD